MKLIEKTGQFRRDFDGIYQCEGCGEKEKREGCYDDNYFHQEVTPEWKCEKCGKSTKDLNIEIQKVETRYPEGMII